MVQKNIAHKSKVLFQNPSNTEIPLSYKFVKSSTLVQLELFLSSGTVCLSFYSLVAAIFGMNIPYTWNENHGYMFKWVCKLLLFMHAHVCSHICCCKILDLILWIKTNNTPCFLAGSYCLGSIFCCDVSHDYSLCSQKGVSRIVKINLLKKGCIGLLHI